MTVGYKFHIGHIILRDERKLGTSNVQRFTGAKTWHQ